MVCRGDSSVHDLEHQSVHPTTGMPTTDESAMSGSQTSMILLGPCSAPGALPTALLTQLPHHMCTAILCMWQAVKGPS